MRDRKVATRYAEALLLSAKQESVLAEVADSYAAVIAVIDGNRDLITFLDSPQVREQEKKALLRKIFGAKIEPVLLNFFMLLIDRNRIHSIRDIGAVFAELVEKDMGVIRAEVVTAIALPDDLAAGLEARLAAMTGARIILEPKTDPAVIGGVCVTMGDKVLDGTVRTNLDLLGKKLGQARVH